jgi:Protein of unknown function (DUF3179)
MLRTCKTAAMAYGTIVGMTSRRVWWLLFGLVSILVVGLVAIPTLHVQPFKPQSGGWLEASYTLRRLNPVLTAAGLLLAVVLAALLWRRARWWSRGALVLALGVAGLLSWFARQNHFEWMFAPLPSPEYVAAADATWVAADDVLMTIDVGGSAVAFPIRQMGYHHVVNDIFGGTPAVVTY